MFSRWRKECREGKLQRDNQMRVGVNKNKRTISAKKFTENTRLKKANDLLKKWQRYLAEQHQSDLDSSKDTEK